jgi:hypothetical protein
MQRIHIEYIHKILKLYSFTIEIFSVCLLAHQPNVGTNRCVKICMATIIS